MAQIIWSKQFFILTFVFIISFILLLFSRVSFGSGGCESHSGSLSDCESAAPTQGEGHVCIYYPNDSCISAMPNSNSCITIAAGCHSDFDIPAGTNGGPGNPNNNSGGGNGDESDIEEVDGTVTEIENPNPCLK